MAWRKLKIEVKGSASCSPSVADVGGGRTWMVPEVLAAWARTTAVAKPFPMTYRRLDDRDCNVECGDLPAHVAAAQHRGGRRPSAGERGER